MSYTRGNRWTDDLIAEEIMSLANQFVHPRMPTDTEVKEMHGYGLSNAICKNGGYEFWANKLGLEQTYSETRRGVHAERLVATMLSDMGYDVQTTPMRYPYDLLINKCVKIDVKAANTSFVRGYPVHAYRLAKPQQTCDFYIMVEDDTNDVYIVPASVCSGQVQVNMGELSLKYSQYKGAFELIQKTIDFYKSLSDSGVHHETA